VTNPWIAAVCGVLSLFGSSLLTQTPAWRHQMQLADYMGIYDLPEELVGFSFTCPANTVRREHLKLEREGSPTPVEYQLSDVEGRASSLPQYD
jgi:hypothetical protein